MRQVLIQAPNPNYVALVLPYVYPDIRPHLAHTMNYHK